MPIQAFAELQPLVANIVCAENDMPFIFRILEA